MTTASISKKQALAYAVAGAAVLGTTATAQADFSGPYDHANWTFDQAGDSSFSSTLTTLTLTGSDDGTTNNAFTSYSIAADADGTVSFDWNYSSNDEGGYDYGGFYINGAFTTLAFNSTQGSGTFSANVLQGDRIGFWVFSVDSRGPTNAPPGDYSGVLDISNFSGPVAVPEPGSLGLLALGTVGGALGFRRRRRS
jgi:hypothetical protein